MTPVITSYLHSKQMDLHGVQNQQLRQMLRDEHFSRVKYLEKGTFDPFLWGRLSVTNYSVYHDLISNQLTRGYLWAQEEDDGEISLQWSTNASSLQKIFFSNNGKLTLLTLMLNDFGANWEETELSVNAFQNMVDNYFNRNHIHASLLSDQFGLPSLQKELEFLPIICRVSDAACEQFAILSNMILNPVKTQVQLGVDEENAPFNPTQQTGRKLAIITDSFFYDALTYINGELQAPKVIVEPVAPVIRSWESLDMIDSLRREDFTDSNNKIDLGLLQRERKVRNLFSLDALTHNTLKDKSSKDLRSWLMIDREDIGKEAYAFRQLTPLQTTASQQLELRIDFKNEAWKLESQFFQKV